MKIIYILMILLSVNVFANEEIVLFEIFDKKYTLEDCKLNNIKWEENTYDQNANLLKDIIKNQKFLFEIKKTPEYKKLNIETAYKKYEEKTNQKLTYLEKTDLQIYLWLEYKKKNIKLSENTKRKYYETFSEDFTIPKSIEAYYILTDDLKDFKYIQNALKYTQNKIKTIYKLANTRNNGKSPYLGWRDKVGYSETFYNEDLFQYLYNEDKNTITTKEIYIPKVKKYIVFYIKNKKEEFVEKYEYAEEKIIEKIKNNMLIDEINKIIFKSKEIKTILYAKNIEKISKK